MLTHVVAKSELKDPAYMTEEDTYRSEVAGAVPYAHLQTFCT